MKRIDKSDKLSIFLVVIAMSVPFLVAGCRSLVSFHDDTYNEAYVQGFNEGAIEGARCGVEWSFTSQGKTIPDVDFTSIIQDYSFYTFPITDYEP